VKHLHGPEREHLSFERKPLNLARRAWACCPGRMASCCPSPGWTRWGCARWWPPCRSW